jgi:surface antigen
MRMRSGSFRIGSVIVAALALGSAAAAQPVHPLYPFLDDGDRARASAAVQDALEHRLSGESEAWRGDSAGVSGTVTPQRTFQIGSGHWCREFQEAVVLPGQAEIRLLTACRSQDDGRWIVVDPAG